MAYIGKDPRLSFTGIARYQAFTGDGSTTTFDLTYATLAGGQNDLQVFVNNVRQEPGASKSYTLGLDGSNAVKRITFNVAPEAAAEIYVIAPGRETALLQPGSNSVTTAMLQDNSVTADKIADGTIIASDVADGAITGAKINSTFDISAKTVTLPASVSGLGTGITNAQLAGSIANAKLANSSFTLNGVSISLGATAEISAGTSWQSVITADGSTTTTAVAGNGYFIDTTSAIHTITLPSSPTLGDEISIIDYAGTFDTNSLTVGRNSENIQGSAADLTVSTERAGFTLVYTDGTQGWLLKDKQDKIWHIQEDNHFTAHLKNSH